jgi:hypothetical protein
MSAIKTVDAFEKLVGLCSGYGESYDPGRPNLQKGQLNHLLQIAREVLHKVQQASTDLQKATNEREVLFEQLRVSASRILSELKAGGALPQTVQDAQLSARILMGSGVKYRPPVASDNATPVVRKRQARGTDYGSRIGQFAKLLELLAREATYRPSQPALKLPALHAQLAQLRQANAAVVAATVNWQLARQQRNEVLYGGANNLVATARAVKFHLRAVFGSRSDAYRATHGLHFTLKQ